MKRLLASLIVLFTLFCLSPAYAKTVVTFEGTMDLSKNTLNLVVDHHGSLITIKANEQKENEYYLAVNIDHLKTNLFDISSEIESIIQVVNDKNKTNSYIQGKIWSNYSLLDFKPIDELAGDFRIKDKKLEVALLKVGKIKCDGFINLTSPHNLNLNIGMGSTNLDDFLELLLEDKDFNSEGDLVGSVQLSGVIDNLTMKGHLESSNGYIKDLTFHTISLNMEGVYPHLQIANSKVYTDDGLSFSFDGPISLGDRKKFKKQIQKLTISPLVNDTKSQKEWTIKRLVDDDGEGATEFKYLLRKDASNNSTENDSAMLGIERSMQF